MKKNIRLSVFCCMLAAALIISCGSNDTATVKISVGLPSGVSVAPQPAGILDRMLRIFTTVAYAQTAPDDVAAIGVRVTGPGMKQFNHIFQADSLVVSIAVQAGRNRRITVFGIDTDGKPKYVGSSLVDLKAGTMRTVNITMQENLRMIDLEAASGSGASYMTFFKNKVYFQGATTAAGSELWAYDLETETAAIVADLYPGNASSSPENLTVFNGKLVFSATDGDLTDSHGRELWSYDGETVPVLIGDIYAGAGSSNPGNLTVIDDKLFFYIWTDGSPGAPYVYDGVNEPYPVDSSNNTSEAREFTKFGDKVFFAAIDNIYGDTELFVYDYNTITKIDIAPLDIYSSNPDNLLVFNGKLFFAATDSLLDREPYVYNGIDDPVKIDLWAGGSSSPNELTIVGGRIYFSAQVADSVYELWLYDDDIATGPKVRRVNNYYDVTAGLNPASFFAVGPVLFYTAQDGVNGVSLWRHISLNGATTPLTNLGSTTMSIYNIIRAGTNISFIAGPSGEVVQQDLWVYDPLRDVKDAEPLQNPYKLEVNSGGYSNPGNDVLTVGNRLFFRAHDSSYENELWTYELF